jgi:DNA primase
MKTLLEVLAENKIETKPSSGGRSVGHCPFHEGDHTPSLTIYPTETFYCFGCGAWGDSIKFLMDYKGMSFVEARDYVGAPVTQQPKRKGVIKVKFMSDTWKLVYEVAEEYHAFLLNNPGAMQYLQGRGLSVKTIKQFMLGYTDGFVLRPSSKSMHWNQLAQEVGILDSDSNETMSHRITIPNLLSASLMADFMVGRTVVNNRVKYLGIRVPKPVMGMSQVIQSPVLLIVEGQFDWLTLRQWGYPAVVAGGSQISRPNLVSLKEKYCIIIPDYDPNGQGQKSAETTRERLGSRAFILDYSSLREGNEKLDVSTLGERPGAEVEFAKILKEQMPWIGNLSDRTIQTYFQGLITTTSFQSTWKPQV